MKRVMLLVLVLIFATETPSAQREETVEIVFKAQDKQSNPYQEEYEKLLYPTVRITSSSGTGSGVFIELKEFIGFIEFKESNSKNSTDSKNSTNYILTAAHVVDNQSIVNIELYNSTVITASVVITDTAKDIAIIKPEINTDSKIKIYTAKLADKNYIPYLFSPVWAVGCSLGLDPRPSFGHITKVNKFTSSPVYESTNELLNPSTRELFWEISAPVLPGNSGGPVYDARTYEVIGIAVWVKVYNGQLITTMAGIVPINQVYKFIESIEFMESNSKNPKNSTNSKN